MGLNRNTSGEKVQSSEPRIYQDFHDQRCTDRRHRKIYFHLQIHLALREVNTLDSSASTRHAVCQSSGDGDTIRLVAVRPSEHLGSHPASSSSHCSLCERARCGTAHPTDHNPSERATFDRFGIAMMELDCQFLECRAFSFVVGAVAAAPRLRTP